MLRKILPAMLLCAVASHATTVTFSTPPGSATSGPVSARATFTTGAGSLFITLSNLQSNPTDVAQLLSDLDFKLSNGASSGTLTSSSGQLVTVNSDHTYTLGSTTSTGWGLNSLSGGGLQLDALGYIGPKGLIIGPPNGSNLYSNANGSILNTAHNPFINQTATFTIAIAGLTSAMSVTSATFSFGTTAGVDIPGEFTTPEPLTLGLTGAGLIGIFFLRRRRSSSR